MLSVIIPFCNEYPQIIFTVRNIAEELRDRVEFEIIAVENYCDEVKAQGREQDKGYEALKATERMNPWLKVLKYDKKLSHWQAKNLGVQESSGQYLWFCDGHCIIGRDSLFKIFEYYQDHYKDLEGTLHLPLTYKIMEQRRLIYKLVDHFEETGEVHYSFTGFKASDEPYRMPCMSTCGMMMTREIYDRLGGWPAELGIYGGGENFINFTLAVLGYKVWIWPSGVLHHHGEKRGYHWTYDDYTRNRTIATYMFGGKALAERFIMNRKGNPEALKAILNNVFDTCSDHWKWIKKNQTLSIEDWLSQWK